MTVMQLSCCKEIQDVHSDREREDKKAKEACVVRWTAGPALAVTKRVLPAPPPMPLQRSVSQATTLPG